MAAFYMDAHANLVFDLFLVFDNWCENVVHFYFFLSRIFASFCFLLVPIKDLLDKYAAISSSGV